jgi:hypothetical protein
VAGLQRGHRVDPCGPSARRSARCRWSDRRADQRRKRTVVAVGINPVDALVLDSSDARAEAQAQLGIAVGIPSQPKYVATYAPATEIPFYLLFKNNSSTKELGHVLAF